MSCGRGRAEDCRPPPLCGAVISPPEHKTTRVNPSIRINSVQRVNSARSKILRQLLRMNEIVADGGDGDRDGE